jgi:hypothetical protein
MSTPEMYLITPDRFIHVVTGAIQIKQLNF